MQGLLSHEAIGTGWVLTGIAHYFGNEGVQKVTDAISKARAAAVPWLAILQVIIPLLLSLFTGGTVTLQQIIDAILALIPQAVS